MLIANSGACQGFGLDEPAMALERNDMAKFWVTCKVKYKTTDEFKDQTHEIIADNDYDARRLAIVKSGENGYIVDATNAPICQYIPERE
jgi:hypothetical protein